jgi:hypothetical protein
MTSLKAMLALAATILGLVASGAALAHGGHRFHHGPRVGVFIGGPVWSPWWYSPPPPRYYYYGYPPVVTSPPAYIEKGDDEDAPADRSSDWHYCPESKAYYPYVKECPGGWQRVKPTPPS